MGISIKRLLIFAAALLARTGVAEGPVAVVDMQRLVSASIVGKAAQSDLQSEAKKREAQLAVRKGEIDKLRQELSKQAGVLSTAALDEKRAAISRKERDFEREVRDQREEIERRRNAAMEKLIAQVDKVVREYAVKNDIRFLVEKDMRVVIYSEPKLDVTDAVLKQLDSAAVGM